MENSAKLSSKIEQFWNSPKSEKLSNLDTHQNRFFLQFGRKFKPKIQFYFQRTRLKNLEHITVPMTWFDRKTLKNWHDLILISSITINPKFCGSYNIQHIWSLTNNILIVVARLSYVLLIIISVINNIPVLWSINNNYLCGCRNESHTVSTRYAQIIFLS